MPTNLQGSFLLPDMKEKIAFKAKYDNLRTEDLKQETKNAYDDYKRETSDRLAFLTEQAKIARSLNISNNTLETQDFKSSDTQILTSLKLISLIICMVINLLKKKLNLLKKESTSLLLYLVCMLRKNLNVLLIRT